jgi:hypothetical protein
MHEQQLTRRENDWDWDWTFHERRERKRNKKWKFGNQKAAKEGGRKVK